MPLIVYNSELSCIELVGQYDFYQDQGVTSERNTNHACLYHNGRSQVLSPTDGRSRSSLVNTPEVGTLMIGGLDYSWSRML